MQQRLASVALLLALALPVQGFSSELIELENAPETSVIYQKAIAPYVIRGVSTYRNAEKRYEAGLPRGDRFYVVARLTRIAGVCALAVVRVSDIDGLKGAIHGRIEHIENETKARIGYKKGDDISVPESAVIDWRITHSDGSEEGDVVGKFITSLGPSVSASDLLVDQRDVDLKALETSQTVENAIEEVFLQLFDDKNLKVESVTSTPPAIKEWPALTRKYHDTTPEVLVADLDTKAAAIRSTKKVTVENSNFQGKQIILVTAYVVLKKGDVLFEVRQFLHFYYRDTKKLDRVTWGLRAGRWIEIKARANHLPDPKSPSVTPPAGAGAAPDVGADH